MPIQVTNSLSGRKEAFTPLEPGHVRMYVCGPTVYNYTHIGNARPAVFFDVVQRFLEFSGYRVTRVVNFTDVDDKILARANEEKTSPEAVAGKYAEAYVADMAALGVRKPAHSPKVSEYIPKIVEFVEGLIRSGAAYVTDNGEVFYSVRGFSGYGKLSGKKLDDLLAGARVAPDEKKRDPLDFSLWKPKKPGEGLSWKSPWAEGRPGWHIECSAMALNLLGESFDIHGGGMDLIHPHHENEIAQSEAFTGKPFVKYWLHSNMLSFGAEKMSKSLGNVLLTRDFIREHSAEVLRFLLLAGHYRSLIDYSDKHLRDCKAGLHRIYSAKQKAAQTAAGTAPAGEPEKTLGTALDTFATLWKQDMEDDFNTAAALSRVYDLTRAINVYLFRNGFKATVETGPLLARFAVELAKFSEVFGLFCEDAAQYLSQLQDHFLKEQGLTRTEIATLINERKQARANKDFATSDRIRDVLLAKGILLKDRAGDTDWDISV